MSGSEQSARSTRPDGRDPLRVPRTTSAGSVALDPEPSCQRCGFPVAFRPVGCKNPCSNCGTVYPLGDCTD